jgi:hypothetical protein
VLHQDAVQQLVGMRATQAGTLKCVERAFNSARRVVGREHASLSGDAIGSGIIIVQKEGYCARLKERHESESTGLKTPGRALIL